MSQFRSLWFTAAIAAITAGSPAFAQDEGDEDEAQTIEGFTEEFETIDGLFPLYRNPEDGALYMEIAADQLDDEFVYFTYAEDGAPRTGLFRGQFRDNRVLTLPAITAKSRSAPRTPASPLTKTMRCHAPPAPTSPARRWPCLRSRLKPKVKTTRRTGSWCRSTRF